MDSSALTGRAPSLLGRLAVCQTVAFNTFRCPHAIAHDIGNPQRLRQACLLIPALARRNVRSKVVRRKLTERHERLIAQPAQAVCFLHLPATRCNKETTEGSHVQPTGRSLLPRSEVFVFRKAPCIDTHNVVFAVNLEAAVSARAPPPMRCRILE